MDITTTRNNGREGENSSTLPHQYLEVDAVVVALPDGEAADEAAAGEAVLVHVHAVQTAMGLVLQPRLAAGRRTWERTIEHEETG